MILYVFIVIFTLGAYLPATGHPHWFFRTPDFIRLQTLGIQLLLLLLFLIIESNYTVFSSILLFLLVATIVYQGIKVFPYSSWYPRKKPDFPHSGGVSILAGNVLQTNASYKKFIDLIHKYNPDLVLTMESNKDWENALSVIEKKYPFSVKVARENFYGMHLYSKKRLLEEEVRFNVEKEVPSIYFQYQVNDHNRIMLVCLHPAPPSPTENETSKERDAELMIVGKYLRNKKLPVVVCGDMNDVVWSRTTRLFKKMTGMIDPRVGRGFFSTYHAGYKLMRFPLDHLFHTKDLYVDTMERSANFGSDHFAMFYEIKLRTDKEDPNKPALNGEEQEEISELIENGKE
jgi:endonuclease/exonuclease/phosphatase (EEP) superfamily protein YafD